MSRSKTRFFGHFLLPAVLLAAACGAQAQTDADDPPTRIARLAYLQGGVSFHPAGADEWVEAGLNRPLTIGDQLWSDRDGRIELQLDASNLRLGPQTAAGILNLNDQSTQIQLSSGTLVVTVRQLAEDESYEIDTPNVAFSILRPGTYRLTVDATGASTAIAVRSGQGEVVGGDGAGYTVRAGEYDTFAGTDTVRADSAALGVADEFDAWCAQRDGRLEHSQAAQYVSPDVVGYQELDNQGDWNDTPDYGQVWFPTVEAGWAPYQTGHWAYVAPWGYTWVDDRPWGFAPFHYGRWVYWRQRWGWVPVPPPRPRVVYVRPVYAPALVAWVGGGATVGWFPLGPREVYVPSYPVSRGYLHGVNVSNTRVSTTVINNYYNTTVINHTTINNVTYANRRVPGALMSASAQDLAGARPVRRGGDPGSHALANGPVRAIAPLVVPTRAAVYGGRGAASLRPPQVVQTRVTAARSAPAAAPANIDTRLQALRDNRGRAPDAAQLARSPQGAPAVRLVPPVRSLVSPREQASARPQTATGAARPAPDAVTGTRAAAPAAAGNAPERALAPPSRPDADRARLQQEPQRRATDSQVADTRRLQNEQQQAAQRQAQSQAQAELARRQQLDQQRADSQRNVQLEQQQAQQRVQAEQQARVQQQAQAQAEQQRNAQLQQQRDVEQRAQQQRAAQQAQLQAQQRVQAEQQARAQQQAQVQAEQQRNQQLERQRENANVQYQRQQQALESQRQQQVQQQQQQQERQQAAARQNEQRRPTPPPPNQRQPR